MQLNDEGHVVTAQGKTTAPRSSTLPAYYVGNPQVNISFASLVLPDGRVVLHSSLLDPDTDTNEDFLYEVHDREDALEAARTMVEDAVDHLSCGGNWLDGNFTIQAWLDRLEDELDGMLH